MVYCVAIWALHNSIGDVSEEGHHKVVNGHDSKYGRTPLLEACLMNRERVVSALINSMNAGMCVICFIHE